MALSCVPSEVSRMFDSMDENGDGRLTSHEINCFLNKLGIQLTKEELKCLVMGVTQSKDDVSLTFDEFVGLYQSLDLDESQSSALMEAFKVYDLNEDGYISSSELQQVLSNLGLLEQGGHYLEDCERMICRFDDNLDAFIDFSEFKNMMTIKS